MADDSVFGGGSTPAVNPTGERSRSSRGVTGAPTWLNNLLNSNPFMQGILGFGQGVQSGGGFVGGLDNASDAYFGSVNSAGNAVKDSFGYVGDKVFGPAMDATGESMSAVSDAVGGFLFGSNRNGSSSDAPPGFVRDEEGNLRPAAGQQEETDIFDVENADPQKLLDRSNRAMMLNQNLTELAESGDLDEQSQLLVNEMRANLVDEMDQLELDLQKQKQQLGVQDALFNFQAKELLGLDMDLAPLEEAIKQEGGVGAQTMLAINDIANNAAMSAEEKADAVDVVMARGHFSDAIVETIDEMVQNRDDLQKLQEMSDTELLGDEARFFSPMFPNVTIADDFERYLGNFDQRIFDSPLGEVVANMDDTQFELYENVQNAVREKGARSAETAPMIQALAQATNTDFETWRNELDAAKIRADNSEAAKEAAVDAKSLKPGSEAMVYALINAGQEMGIPDDILTLLANSAEVHAIIETKSGGKAGKVGNGTIRGIGGLTEDMYHQLMGESWGPDKGMQYELQALLAYIIRGHEGDPIKALDFYRKTGEWGGVQSLEGGEVVEQPDNGAQASTAAGR